DGVGGRAGPADGGGDPEAGHGTGPYLRALHAAGVLRISSGVPPQPGLQLPAVVPRPGRGSMAAREADPVGALLPTGGARPPARRKAPRRGAGHSRLGGPGRGPVVRRWTPGPGDHPQLDETVPGDVGRAVRLLPR